MKRQETAYSVVMDYFYEISKIPRGSYHEEQIATYLEDFAHKRGLACYRDEIGNVLIDCPATEGYESEPPLLMQGHTDMVCEKNEGVAHDFLKDPLSLYEENGWLRARGTTLGADNGVAVAIMMAALDGALSPHPPLQCLFTVSEEVGLDGMKHFDMSRVYARQMLNMDSADESTVVVGCAGGLRSDLTLPVGREKEKKTLWTLRVNGLAGGHSGEDIHRGRANANQLLAEALEQWMAGDSQMRLVKFYGGSKDNAIPREATAIVSAEQEMKCVKELERRIRQGLCPEDIGFTLTLSPCAGADLLPMDRSSSQKIVQFIRSVKNGVLAMCPNLPDLVEYSRNLAVVRTEEDCVQITFSSRSAMEAQIDQSAAELDALAAELGGSARHYSRYPGWSFEEKSPLRERYVAAYESLFGRAPRMETIHAGLECGLAKEKIPDMDILSCGPIILNLHSPDEAMDLASLSRFVTIIGTLLRSRSDS